MIHKSDYTSLALSMILHEKGIVCERYGVVWERPDNERLAIIEGLADSIKAWEYAKKLRKIKKRHILDEVVENIQSQNHVKIR